MREGDLVFVRGKGFIAWAIRQTTGGYWNHVMTFVGRGQCVSADPPRVRYCSIAEYTERGDEVSYGRVIAASDGMASAVAQDMREQVGKSYDLTAIIGIWFKFACKWARIPFIVFWGKNKAASDRALFCSESIGLLWASRGICFTDEDASWLTPSQIHASYQIARLDS